MAKRSYTVHGCDLLGFGWRRARTPGEVVELDDSDEVVARLVERGKLIPLDLEEAALEEE